MSPFKKGEHIVLKNSANIIAKSSTLLVCGKDCGLEAFLNDYNLATYVTKALIMKILIGI